jgi:O-antigen/teichoic acid export membrane protein
LSNPLKKLASQTAIYGLGNVLPRIMTYVFSLVLTYIFKEPAVLAPNATFFAIISFINIIFTYGMETAFFNFANKAENKERVYSTTLISILVSTVALTLIFILFSSSIAKVIKYPGHADFVIWCVLIVATDSIMAIPFARLRLNNNAKRFASIKLVNVFANISKMHFITNRIRF